MAKILLLKAKLAGANTADLFLATVPVRGHMRGSSFVAPHMAQREKRQAIVLAQPNRALYPNSFDRIAGYETKFNSTIHRSETVHQRADKGTPYAAAIANPEAARLADQPEWTGDMLVPPAQWRLPAGAGNTDKSGPT